MRPLCHPVLWLLLLWAVVLAGCGGADPSLEDGLQAGFARVDVTPYGVPVKMAGYGVYLGDESNCRWSQGVHDPLYAHAMALEDKRRGAAAVLVVVDLIGLMLDDAARIRREIGSFLGIDERWVVVSATHTHHGPDTLGLHGTILPPVSGRQEEVVDGLIRGAVQAGVRAWEVRRPAEFFFAVGEETGLHENRVYGDPHRTIDHTATFLAARNGAGELLGTLLNWACHPTVMGEKSRLLSSDFAGAYYREMAGSLAGVHLFVNGALGASIEPVERFLDPDRWDEVDRFGRVLAGKAREWLERADPLREPLLTPPVTRPVPVPLENPFFRIVLAFDLVPREAPLPGQDDQTLVTAFALGPVRFGTLPGEFVPDYSFRLRRILGGEAQVIVGLGQDAFGYAVTPQQYENPAYAYERLLSPGGRTGERVMEVYEGIADNIAMHP